MLDQLQSVYVERVVPKNSHMPQLFRRHQMFTGSVNRSYAGIHPPPGIKSVLVGFYPPPYRTRPPLIPATHAMFLTSIVKKTAQVSPFSPKSIPILPKAMLQTYTKIILWSRKGGKKAKTFSIPSTLDAEDFAFTMNVALNGGGNGKWEVVYLCNPGQVTISKISDENGGFIPFLCVDVVAS